MNKDVEAFMEKVSSRSGNEPEFIQAVQEVMESVIPFVQENPEYGDFALLERLTEPDRVISFRVTWTDDLGVVRVNRGYRVQFNNAIGLYKGGLRFHQSVSQSILKFLAFEQCFKNSLTTLPLGGGKGGSDFDPKGKSDAEIMRFCQSFMTELSRYIGEDTDVPAGDIGVGSREIGYLYGQYKRLLNRSVGVLTGKGLSYGGSVLRPEATGYGVVYFLKNMLRHSGDSLEGKTALVSGSGNVSLHAIEKLLEFGVKVLTASDSEGFVHDEGGFTPEKLDWLKELKFERRGRLREYAEHFGLEFSKGKPWKVPADLALPCATQNEIVAADAKELVTNGVLAVAEGANMPTNSNAIAILNDCEVLFAPGKAANAGGVAVSGLEQTQNSLRLSWDTKRVDEELRSIMSNIHDTCVEFGTDELGRVDYLYGANIGGFVKIAEAMAAQGVM